MENKVMFTTLEHVPGADIEEHMGMVYGIGIVRSSFKERILWRMKSFFGGESSALDNMFTTARDRAYADLQMKATSLGANGILNTRLESIRNDDASCEVHVYGSAVRYTSF